VNQIFGTTYADACDLLYLAKDYSTECNLIDKLFHTCGNDSISTILNLSCGTGNDAFPLAGRVYEVVGVDGSKNMLAQAREKLTNTQTKLKLSFREGDLRSVKLPMERPWGCLRGVIYSGEILDWVFEYRKTG
jgi:ubiquinone/menaquinone biosynthesis C-methylase UbiE